MKFLLTGVIALLSYTGYTQVSSDSISILKQQKQSLELSSRINDRKMQLAKLENSVDKKTKDVEYTTAEAQRAADENKEAAAKLSNDSQDKRSAKQARKAAGNAEHKAKAARKAADDLADLNKDIESLKSKIADDEAKLAVNPVIIPSKQ
jgi:chromosome segregation ATPase